VVDPIERHFDKIILWIVDETQQGQPLRRHVIAQSERGDLDFDLLALEQFRYEVKKRVPIRLVEFPDRHGKPLSCIPTVTVIFVRFGLFGKSERR
jgi:hypothetical protein